MESKQEIYHLWVQYTTKNEEIYFRKFVQGFVAIWESQLNLDWFRPPEWKTIKHDTGPHLSRLPEELLPALGKFFYIAKEQTEKNILDAEALEQLNLLIRCLIIISRNFDNIPFIASCDYVSHLIGITATIIHQIIENSSTSSSNSELTIHLCHLLEVLYDPYFTSRHIALGQRVNRGQLPLQPALLHVEVIPFIYDCFQIPIVEKLPNLTCELLNVLGGIISGAKHNALRAICPATVNIVLGVICHQQVTTSIASLASHCFILMVQILNKASADQRQIEVITLVQQLCEVCSEVSQSGSASSAQWCAITIKKLLIISEIDSRLWEIVRDQRALDVNIVLLESAKRFAFKESQNVACECISTMSFLLKNDPQIQNRMERHIGYERLLQALRRLGEPSEPLLKNLIVFAGPPDIQNPQAILLLVRWLVELPDIELQSWLTNELYSLCTGTHAARTRACRSHVALHACHALERHTRLGEHSARELIRLVESLAHHSITPQELKHILLLLREEPGQDTFPYRIHLLHALSAIARKTSSPLSPNATPGLNHECLCYFDIQDDKDGLFVPDISKWPGASYGFSFHCWVRFDHIQENKNQGFRRQLFNVSTSSGVGLEAFLRSDGALTVGISTKKEYLAAVATPPTTSSGSDLADGRWHSVSICHQAARRPFGQNHLFIYLDGVQRIQAAIKSPAMTDPFANCVIGGIAPTPPPQNLRTQTSLPAPQGLLPSIIQQVPSYLTLPLRSAPLDPSVKAFPAGMQDVLWGNQISMRGQLAFVALFHESLSTNQVKALYEAGPCCAINLANDESSNDQVTDLTDLSNKLVFCYSPMAASEGRCLDLASQHKFTATYRGSLIKLQCIKESLVAVGGIHALFPILEAACRGSGTDDPDLSLVSPSVVKEASIMEGNENKADREDWEILPSSSYSDWKLEQNPISGFLSLIKNLTSKAPLHQEQLVRSQGLQVIGLLLSKAKANLIDVNVLMAIQLLAESARDVGNQHLLRALYQHLLFNFSIWSHGPFHIRVGHAQYLATVIKDERRVLRRRYGVQYLLDVIKRHCARPDGISEDDVKTVRMSLIGLVKFYVQREVSAKEVRALIGYILVTTRDEPLASEVTDLIASCLEVRQSSRDQLHLLLMEPGVVDLLYLLVVDPSTNIELKQKILKVFSILLRSDRIYDRSKARLRLQEGDCYTGLVALLSNQTLTSDFLGLLMDQILITDSMCAYSGALALLYSLSNAEMNLKLEVARKLLIVTFMRPSAAQLIAKQTGWQDCITRLLVKRPIQSDDNPLPDLMSFEEHFVNSSLPSNNDSSAASVAAAAASAALAAVPGGSFVTDAAVALGDEVKEAAGNLSSAVANAYSALRQKTVEMQESLEELGESAVSKLKTRRSLISIYEGNENIAPGSPRPFRAPTELLATLGLDVDSVSLAERSSSSSTSTEELSASSHGPAATTASASDATSLASHGSGAGDDNTLQHWRSLEGDPRADETEELCSIVSNLLFTVLWRGMDGSDGDTWRRRGQVLAAVNLLGLNNELHCSHLELKLRLLEMGAQAALSDLREASQSQSVVQAENAAHLLRWIYDLVVLDPATNLRHPRVSTKLLDAVLGLLDTLLVFQDGLDEWTELVRVGLGVLLACAGHEDLELCAMATAKLHALVQTRPANTEEASYLLGRLDHSLQRALNQGRDEQYAFLMPVVKALLDRLQTPLHLSSHLPDLTRLRAGPAFFEDFRAFCQTPPWRDFVLKKVTPLQEAYEAQVQAQLGASLDNFWAECYETCKAASHKRLRECAEARHRLQVHILGPARLRQCEEASRFAAVGAQERVEEAAAQRRWRKLKHELTGPRGTWQAR